MEISTSKDDILGKRKRSQEEENDELKMIKAKDDVDSSEKEKASSKTVLNDAYRPGPSKEDNSKLLEDKEENSETTSESSPAEIKEESSIEKLLRDALDILRKKIKVEDTSVKTAYEEIKESFKGFQFTKVDFNNSCKLIAYFSMYSIFNTKLSRNRFVDAFKNCKQLQETVKKQDLNIISLGGGPGTDMIGFCSALHDFLTPEVKDFCSSINITIADLWKRWASFYNVNEFLIREGNYGNVSTLFKSNVVNSSFMMVDLLSKKQPHKYANDLGTADIVLLVRVLDSLNFRETDPCALVKKIIAGMKSGALLLVIDSVIRDLDSDDVNLVYESDLDEYICRYIEQHLEKLFLCDQKSSKANTIILQKK